MTPRALREARSTAEKLAAAHVEYTRSGNYTQRRRAAAGMLRAARQLIRDGWTPLRYIGGGWHGHGPSAFRVWKRASQRATIYPSNIVFWGR